MVRPSFQGERPRESCHLISVEFYIEFKIRNISNHQSNTAFRRFTKINEIETTFFYICVLSILTAIGNNSGFRFPFVYSQNDSNENLSLRTNAHGTLL